MEERKRQDPLLYITQPIFTEARPFMQENYSSLTKTPNTEEKAEKQIKEVKDQENDLASRPIRERRRRANPFFDLVEEDDEVVIDQVDEAALSEAQESKAKVKETNDKNKDSNFQDLSIQEKIDYFTELPAEMPKIKCEVVTENESFYGHIETDNDDHIVMITKGWSETIKKSDIQNILLIGF